MRGVVILIIQRDRSGHDESDAVLRCMYTAKNGTSFPCGMEGK